MANGTTPALDPRGAQDFTFDVEVDRRVNEAVADDVARNLSVIDPFMAEDIQRKADWARNVGEQELINRPAESPAAEQAVPVPAPAQAPAQDRLAQLEAEVQAKQAALEQSNLELGRLQNKFGDERKRTAERLARLEAAANGTPYDAPNRQTASQYQAPVGYDPRILGNRNPDEPMTAGEVASLLQAQSFAFGQAISSREQAILEAAKRLRDYDLTPNEEADLIDRHGWLATIDRASQISAMRDLVKPLRAASQPAAAPAPIKPQGVDMAELARQRHLTATTFIEPSSRGSAQERDAVAGVDSGLAKKIKEYHDLMAKPYGTPGVSEKAEAMLKEISAMQRRR